MLKFPENRITLTSISSSRFEEPIPTAIVKPEIENEQTVVFIFNGGLGATNQGNLYMNHKFYDNHYFVSYEKSGNGNNNNKPSQYRKHWLTQLDEVVNWTRSQFPDKQIYLLGESWGSAINIVYYIKNYQKLDGVINWNMPTKPIDPEKKQKKFKEMFPIAIKQLTTVLFNVPFKMKAVQKNYGTLTRDPVLIRAMAVAPEAKQNTILTAAVWRFMGKSRRALLKYGKNPQYRFNYVQSGDDALLDRKMLVKYDKHMDQDHYTFIPTGYHLLSMEPIEADQLYNVISNFITKK